MTTEQKEPPDHVKGAADQLTAATRAKERALAALNRATATYEQAADAEKRAMEVRDQAIKDDVGRSQAVLARITGLSRGRIGQIRAK